MDRNSHTCPSKYEIVVADDYTLFRQLLVRVLSDYPEFGPIREAKDGEQLLEKIQEQEPDIVLLDLNMPVMNGLKAMSVIRNTFPGLKVIVISMYREPEFIAKLIKDGVKGFILKDAILEEVATAIKLVAQGKRYLNEVMANALDKNVQAKFNLNIYAEIGVDLTNQERKLLQHIVAQRSNRQIAEEMQLSIRTVEYYRSNLMQKIGVNNSAGLMAYAIKHILPEPK